MQSSFCNRKSWRRRKDTSSNSKTHTHMCSTGISTGTNESPTDRHTSFQPTILPSLPQRQASHLSKVFN